MGINAIGYFVTKRPMTDEEIARILDDFKATYYDQWPIKFYSLRTDEEMTPSCVAIDFDLDRLYSSGYARGNFVKHVTVCGWLRRRPYVEAVYYGGDHSSYTELCEWTEKNEQELFNLYMTNNTDSYRESKRDWFKG